MGAQIDLQHAANLAGLSFKTLKTLNPGYNRAITDPNGPYKLVLPIENVEQFSENLASSSAYGSKNWVHYKLRRNDNVKTIAKKFNITPTQLRKMNPELASNRLKSGMSIIIPNTSNSSIQNEDILQMASAEDVDTLKVKNKIREVISQHNEEMMQAQYTLQPGDTLYMVRDGDDISKIARRFNQSVKTIYAANNMHPPQKIQPGSQLIIPTHLTSDNNNDDENNPAKKFELNPGDTLYMVRQGDTIETIAEKYHITPSMLRLANLMADNNIREGDQIIIPNHV